MSNSFYGSRYGQIRYNVMLEQGAKPCRRVDYRDRNGRLICRVWSYESDGHASQLTYSALDGYESGVCRAPESFLNYSPVSQS